jgi:hypothetical protein
MATQARALFGAPLSHIFGKNYIYHILNRENHRKNGEFRLTFKKIEQRAQS